MQAHHINFRAMGSAMSVSVWAPPRRGAIAEQLCALAPVRIELLEQSWSRFRPDSELSRNNAHAGRGPMEISNDFAELVTAMIAAERLTIGLFNPTMARVIEALGYNVNFADITQHHRAVDMPQVASTAGIHLQGNTLALDAGVALDPGALGKGLAGDILCREFMAAGAIGVVTNFGGDVVALGTPGEDVWRIDIVNEASERKSSNQELLTTIERDTSALAVATSTTTRKRWAGVHHVIDPRTGNVAQSDLLQTTVVAESGVQSEALATAGMVLGRAAGTEFFRQKKIEHYFVSKQEFRGDHALRQELTA